MKAAHYTDIGLFLKESRESLGISISEAGRALHIRPAYLTALESGKLELLPGKTYIRGYIRTYAGYLGVDAQEVLAEFDAIAPVQSEKDFIPTPTRRESLPARWLLVLVVSGCMVLFLYYYFFSESQRASMIRAGEVPAGLMFDALALRHPQVAAWRECLGSGEAECFIRFREKQVSWQVAEEYKQAVRLLVPVPPDGGHGR